MVRRVLSTVLALTLAGCALHEDSSNGSGDGVLHIVNGARVAGSLGVYIDGAFLGPLAVADVGTATQIGGLHTLEVRFGNGNPGFTFNFSIHGSETITVVATDSAGGLTRSVLLDSNTVVPAGATKLRVANFAQTIGKIDVWRTQPDFGTPSRVVFPFVYGFTSAYIQSTPGDWRVMVSDTVPTATPNAPMPDTLGATAAITIPAGGSRTVIVVDGATAHTADFVILIP